MDMTENNDNYTDIAALDDDLLLEQFFQAARAEQLPDDGFSRQVMMLLPERQQRLSRRWTIVCVVIAVTLFFLTGGWQLLTLTVINILTGLHTTTQLLQLMVCGAVLTALAAAELLQREEHHLTIA